MPKFKIERLEVDSADGSHTVLCVGCPECHGEFWIGTRWAFLAPHRMGIRERDCPYCGTPGAIPKKYARKLKVVRRGGSRG